MEPYYYATYIQNLKREYSTTSGNHVALYKCNIPGITLPTKIR